jgi:hypothetical protein
MDAPRYSFMFMVILADRGCCGTEKRCGHCHALDISQGSGLKCTQSNWSVHCGNTDLLKSMAVKVPWGSVWAWLAKYTAFKFQWNQQKGNINTQI